MATGILVGGFGWAFRQKAADLGPEAGIIAQCNQDDAGT
jgi:hypothetical protein